MSLYPAQGAPRKHYFLENVITTTTIAQFRPKNSCFHNDYTFLLTTDPSLEFAFFDPGCFPRDHVLDFWKFDPTKYYSEMHSGRPDLLIEISSDDVDKIMESLEKYAKFFRYNTSLSLTFHENYFPFKLWKFLSLIGTQGCSDIYIRRDDSWTNGALTLAAHEKINLKMIDRYNHIEELVLDERVEVRDINLPKLRKLKISFTLQYGSTIFKVVNVNAPMLVDLRVHYKKVIPLIANSCLGSSANSGESTCFELSDIDHIFYTNISKSFQEIPYPPSVHDSDYTFLKNFKAIILCGIPDLVIKRMDLSHVEHLTWRRVSYYQFEDYYCTPSSKNHPITLNEKIKDLYIENNLQRLLPKFSGVLEGGSLSIRFGYRLAGKIGPMQMFDQGSQSVIPTFNNIALYNTYYNASPSVRVPSARRQAIFVHCNIGNSPLLTADSVTIFRHSNGSTNSNPPSFMEIRISSDAVKDLTIYQPRVLLARERMYVHAVVRLLFEESSSSVKLYFIVRSWLYIPAKDKLLKLRDKVLVTYNAEGVAGSARVTELRPIKPHYYNGISSLFQKSTPTEAPIAQYCDEKISGKVSINL